MKKLKKNKILFNLIILLALSFGIIFIIYKKTNPRNLKEVFLSMNKKYLFYAMIFFMLFRLMEAIGLYKMFRNFGQRVKMKNCINYSILRYFFSQLTLSGSGGQPGQFYFMIRDGIKADKALSVIVPFNILYHFSLNAFGLISLTTGLRHVIFDEKMRLLFYFGLLVQLIMFLTIILAFVKSDVLSRIIIAIVYRIRNIPFLERFYRDPEFIMENIEGIKTNVMSIVADKRKFFKLFLLQAVMLFFYYGMTYFTYRAMGFTNYGIFDITRAQSLITVAVEFIPTPGAAGFSELMMFTAYNRLIPQDMALNWMMVNRLLNLYLAVLITLIILYRRNLIRKPIRHLN